MNSLTFLRPRRRWRPFPWSRRGPAGTLDAVQARAASCICGVSQGLPGFSNPMPRASGTGIDVDFCRAVAAAVLGDATKVKFTPLSAKERFTALQSGEIDVLSRNTTWTMTRDTAARPRLRRRHLSTTARASWCARRSA